MSHRAAYVLCVIMLGAFGAVMTVVFYTKTMSLQLHLEELQTNKQCLLCCMQNHPCAAEEKCRGRLDDDVCNRVIIANHNASRSNAITWKQVVKATLLRNLETENINTHIIGKYGDRADKVRANLYGLSTLVLRPPKPVAHVGGHKGWLHTGEKSLQSHHQEQRRDAKWKTYETGYGTSFNQTSESLEVPYTGSYFLYVHTTFFSDVAGHKVSCRLAHEVKRHNEMNQKRGKTIMRSQARRSCGDVGSKEYLVPRYWFNTSNMGFHTLDTKGVHRLEKGDKLTVHYHNPPYVEVGTKDRETYFGLFML